MIAVHHTDWFYPIFARYVPAPTTDGRPRSASMTSPPGCAAIRSWPGPSQRQLESLRAGGPSPFVITPTYALTSTLEFYLPGQPETYCLSWNYGMTSRSGQPARPLASQPAARPGAVPRPAGRRGRRREHAAELFDASVNKRVVGRIEPIERVEVKEHGVIVGAWDITVCHDYRGIGDYRQNGPYRLSDPRSRKVRWPKGSKRA